MRVLANLPLQRNCEIRQLGLVETLFHQCADIEHPFDLQNVIEPDQDCCSLFTPPHPSTKTRLNGYGEAADLLRMVGDFHLVHADERAQNR